MVKPVKSVESRVHVHVIYVLAEKGQSENLDVNPNLRT